MTRPHPDGFNELDTELHGLFAQATADIAPRHDLTHGIQDRIAAGGAVQSAGAQRFSPISITLSAFVLVALLAGAFVWFRPGGTQSRVARTPTPTLGAPTAQATAPFAVTSVDLSVNPGNIAGATCGSPATFTYTAVFHMPAHTAGGVIQFAYTLNNGRSQTAASVSAKAGTTSTSYTFSSAGTLPADHSYPGNAQVMVTSPSQVLSPSVTPSGSCVVSGPFQVTSVGMSVSPSSIANRACGTFLTVTYTATFHIAANGAGGTIQFQHTINNGRASTPGSIVVAQGQTTASYTFTWSGNLPIDHTYPEQGGVLVQSPNAVNSPLIGPSGACH